MSEITLKMMVDEIEREIKMRKQVYGRQVDRGSMKKREADHLIAIMEAVRDVLKQLHEEQRLEVHT